jgi:hypothetical protein
MITPVFAFLSSGAEKIAALAIKCLAVAGAFLLGYFLGMAIVWAIDKWLLANKTPYAVKKVCKTLTGLIVAIIVALIVFGEGGSGLFGGGGGGKGSTDADSSTDKSKHSDPLTPDAKVQPSVTLPKPPDAKSADLIIQVTIYGGSNVIDERYYQVDDEQMLKNFKELQDAILTRSGKEKGKVAVSIRLPTDKNTASGDPRAINMVTEWANKQGLDVMFPANR